MILALENCYFRPKGQFLATLSQPGSKTAEFGAKIQFLNGYYTVRPACAAALYLVPRKMTMFLGSLGNLSRGPQLHLVHIYGLFKSYERFNIKVL